MIIFLEKVSKYVGVHQYLSAFAQNIHSLFHKLNLMLHKKKTTLFSQINHLINNVNKPQPMSCCAAAFLPSFPRRLHRVYSPGEGNPCDSCIGCSKTNSAAMQLYLCWIGRHLRRSDCKDDYLTTKRNNKTIVKGRKRSTITKHLPSSKGFQAGPAKMRIAIFAQHVIATAALFNGSLAFGALLY